MADPRDLVTLTQVQNYLIQQDASFNSTWVAQVGPMAITAVSQDWLTFTGRRSLNNFVPCADTFDAAGGDKQFLAEFPAAAVSGVYVFGNQVPEGGFGTSGQVTPGWVLDRKRESVSMVGYAGGWYGLAPGPGGAYAATGGPLTRVFGGWKFGRQNDRNFQNVLIQYFGGGSVMFSEQTTLTGATYTVSQAANFYMNLGVTYSLPQNGELVKLTAVPSGPAVGQYSVSNAGVYTFNAGDNGNPVSLQYAYNLAPPEVQQFALIQIAETLFMRKRLGLKQQGSQESGTTTYTWDIPRPKMVQTVMQKYKRAMVGV